MTREQIEALSDDPDEMQQQLQDMAGGNAVIRVDSFEGGRLPPKSAIKSIHITRDAFAAENHYAGGLFIDIITQPGIGPLRTNMNVRFRAGRPERRSPCAARRHRAAEGARGHPVLQRRPRRLADQAKGVVLDKCQQQRLVRHALPALLHAGRQLVEGLAPRRPRDNMFVFALFDYAITKDQTLRANFSHDQSTSKDVGVNLWDLPERAYSTEDHNNTLRIQEAGPLGRRFFINTRTSINWSNSDSHSVFEGPTIRVVDDVHQRRTADGGRA